MHAAGNALQSQDTPRKLAHLVMQGSPGILCSQEGKNCSVSVTVPQQSRLSAGCLMTDI